MIIENTADIRIAKAKKSIAHGSNIMLEIQPDHTVVWWLEGGWVTKPKKPKKAKIYYDANRLDSDNEPRGFFKTTVSTYYLDEFTLL
jgi:hypothetical protein